MLFKNLLNSRMKERKLSVNDVFQLSDVKRTSIGMYLQGAVPSSDDETKLCNALDINIDDVTYSEWSISVVEASKMMQKGTEYVKNAIERRSLPGSFVPTKKGNRYHIPRQAFMKYLEEWNNNDDVYSAIYQLLSSINGIVNQLIAVDALKKVAPSYHSTSDN